MGSNFIYRDVNLYLHSLIISTDKSQVKLIKIQREAHKYFIHSWSGKTLKGTKL